MDSGDRDFPEVDCLWRTSNYVASVDTGAINARGQPQTPIYYIGKLSSAEQITEHVTNLLITSTENDISISLFYLSLTVTDAVAVNCEPSAMHPIVGGQLTPHISTEVDCESLFSETVFLTDKRRS